MKKALKRSLSILLAVIIIFSSAYVGLSEVDLGGLFTVKAQAASESDLTFELNSDGESYSVAACDSSASGSLTIPSTYNGKPVTAIGEAAFMECELLSEIILPDSVTSIGVAAIAYCTSLISIGIPDSVTSIGDYAFAGCLSMTSIEIPGSVTYMGVSVFIECESFTSINVDVNNEYYSSQDGILFDKSQTVLIQYPAGKADTSYVIPDGVISIGVDAFMYCSSLVSIEISDSVTSIGDYAFEYCSSLTSIDIPNSVISIGDQAFYECTSLTSIKIPDGVTKIGSLAFMDCEALEKVYISASVTSIGAQAFYGFKGEIYCERGSFAHEYAISNNIGFALLSLSGNEETKIDYDNFLIFTSVQGSNRISEVFGVSETATVIPVASHISGNYEFLGTGSVISVFEGDACIGNFTLIVAGDINGDSICDVIDCAQVDRVLNGYDTLEGAYAMAADCNTDDVIGVNDYQDIVNKALTD